MKALEADRHTERFWMSNSWSNADDRNWCELYGGCCWVFLICPDSFGVLFGLFRVRFYWKILTFQRGTFETHKILYVAKSRCQLSELFLYMSLVKSWHSSKEITKQKWVPLCLFSASFQIRTAQTWRQKRGSAVEYAACSFYLVLSDLSLGSSWCRKMICDIYDVWHIMYDIWRQKRGSVVEYAACSSFSV